jgi:outer membrane receptor protein involved in Fe transport
MHIGARMCGSIMAAVILLLLFAPTGARGAVPAGTVTGIAKDALERPLGAVQLRLETGDGQVVARTTTDAQGRFTFADVPPGTYAVVGEKTGFDTATAVVTVAEQEGASADLTLASREALDVRVAAQRLQEARISIQPRIGASTYTFSEEAIRALPGGDNNSLRDVLLQAPGVTQDTTGSGGLHVRNEHANVQYRINGVALPDGANVFGQSGGLSPRLAASTELITGALPAQYGLRTAGIVDVQTKSGALEPGGYVGMYGGSHSWLQPSAEYAGSLGRFNYFVTGDYLQNSIGISPATPHGPIHDDTQQGHGFGYFEYLLDATSKVSAIVGSFVGHFEIPNARGVTPAFTVTGITDFDSTKINERQLEQNYYAVLSYLKAQADLAYQLSLFSRYTRLTFHPDRLADIMFNGIAQGLERTSIASGLQLEGSYVLTPQHTLRAGLLVTAERESVQSRSLVLPVDDSGMQTDDTPIHIFDSTGKTGYTYSLYVQDAWRIVPTLTINAGLRFDDLEAFSSERQLSPRINAVWTPTKETTVHAGYARYFTPPPLIFTSTRTFNKFVGTSGAPPGDPTVNDSLKAEKAHYFDVGVSQQILPGLKVGLDAYYKIALDLVDDGQFGAPILTTPFNYKEGRNQGVELTVTYNVGGFSAYGNLAAATQKARHIVSAQALFKPDDLAFIRDHFIATDHSQTITTSAGLSYLWDRTRVSLDMLAGSGLRRTVNHPNDGTVPPYSQLNVGVSQGFTLASLGKFQARFDVINVLDSNYVLRNGTGIGVFARQFGPPRGFFGGLRKEF